MKTASAILVSAFLLGSCAAADANRSMKGAVTEMVISGNGDLDIPKSKIPALEQEALAGSGSAANKLGRYYFFVMLDSPSGLYWETISAEDGSTVGMCNLAIRLQLQDDPRDKARAVYWRKRAGGHCQSDR